MTVVKSGGLTSVADQDMVSQYRTDPTLDVSFGDGAAYISIVVQGVDGASTTFWVAYVSAVETFYTP